MFHLTEHCIYICIAFRNLEDQNELRVGKFSVIRHKQSYLEVRLGFQLSLDWK